MVSREGQRDIVRYLGRVREILCGIYAGSERYCVVSREGQRAIVWYLGRVRD